MSVSSGSGDSGGIVGDGALVGAGAIVVVVVVAAGVGEAGCEAGISPGATIFNRISSLFPSH